MYIHSSHILLLQQFIYIVVHRYIHTQYCLRIRTVDIYIYLLKLHFAHLCYILYSCYLSGAALCPPLLYTICLLAQWSGALPTSAIYYIAALSVERHFAHLCYILYACSLSGAALCPPLLYTIWLLSQWSGTLPTSDIYYIVAISVERHFAQICYIQYGYYLSGVALCPNLLYTIWLLSQWSGTLPTSATYYMLAVSVERHFAHLCCILYGCYLSGEMSDLRHSPISIRERWRCIRSINFKGAITPTVC